MFLYLCGAAGRLGQGFFLEPINSAKNSPRGSERLKIVYMLGFLESPKERKIQTYLVKVHHAPISKRYWWEGCEGRVDPNCNQIRLGGVWFDLDERFVIENIV